MTRKCKKGSYMALFTLVVIAAVIVLNLIVGKLPAKYLKHDLSSNKILTLGDTTRDILAQLRDTLPSILWPIPIQWMRGLHPCESV